MIDLLSYPCAEGEPCEPAAATLQPLSVPAPYDSFGPLLNYDLSRVDLSRFPSITARIDRVDVTAWDDDLSKAGFTRLRDAFGSRVTSSRKIRGAEGLFFMVNDLTSKDLRFLVHHYYSRPIRRFEVAVDFKLREGENDFRHLWLLKAQIRHCLAPQGFPRLSEALRKVYTSSLDGRGRERGRFVPDGLGTPPAHEQVIWENQRQSADVVGLYVKTHDRLEPLQGQPFVRLELRLRDAGPASAGLGFLGLLPAFAESTRTTFAPAFHIASGFKSPAAVSGRGVPRDAWGRWGATWATKHGYELKPDAEANMRIGLALKDLRKMFMGIPVPGDLIGRYSDWVDSHS